MPITDAQLALLAQGLQPQQDTAGSLGVLGSAKEVGKQAAAGALVDLPKTVGQAGRAVTPTGSDANQWFDEMQRNAEARGQDYQPDPRANGVTKFLASGARGVSQAAPLIGASLIPGVGEALAVGGGAGLYGLSGGQAKADELRAAGASEEDVHKGALASGLIDAAAGGAGQFIGGRYLWPGAGGLSTAEKGSAQGAIDALGSRSPSILNNYAKGIASDAATMGLQGAADQAVSNVYGGNQGSVLDAGAQGAEGGAALGVVGGTIGVRTTLAEKQLAKHVKSTADALESPLMPKENFDQAVGFLSQQLQAKGVAPDVVQDWAAKLNTSRQQAIWDAQQPTDMLKLGYNGKKAEPPTLYGTPDGQVATSPEAAFANSVQPQPAMPGAWNPQEQPLHEWLNDQLKRPAPITATDADNLLQRNQPEPVAPTPPTPVDVPPGQRTAVQGGVNDLLNAKDVPQPGKLDVTKAWMNNPDIAMSAMQQHLDRLSNAHDLDSKAAADAQAKELLQKRASDQGINTEAGQRHFGSLESLRDAGAVTPKEFAEAVSLMRDKKAAAYGEIKRQIAEATEKLKGQQDGNQLSGVQPIPAAGNPGASPDAAGGVRPADVPGAGATQPVRSATPGTAASGGQAALVADAVSKPVAPVTSLADAHSAINGYTQARGAEKMKLAMRHVLGLDNDGDQVNSPKSLQDAAAAVGYKSHAPLQRAMDGLGLGDDARGKILAGGGMDAGAASTAAEAGLSTQKGATQSADERSTAGKADFDAGRFHKLTDDQFQTHAEQFFAKYDPKNAMDNAKAARIMDHAKSRTHAEEAHEDAARVAAEDHTKDVGDYKLEYDEDGQPIYSSGGSGGEWSADETRLHKAEVLDSLHDGLMDGSVKQVGPMLMDAHLMEHPAVRQVMQSMQQRGLSGMTSRIFAITSKDLGGKADAVAWKHGPSGKTVIVMDSGRLSKPELSGEVADDLNHELGHAVVDTLGLHARGEMQVITNELFGLYKQYAAWREQLQYPMRVKDMPHAVRREELFAQAWKLYSNPLAIDDLRQDAPNTYAALEKVTDDLRQQLSSSATGSTAAGEQVSGGASGGTPSRIAGAERAESNANAGNPAVDPGQPAGSQDRTGGSAAGVRQDQAADPEAGSGNLRSTRTLDPKRPVTPADIGSLRDEIARLTPEPVKNATTRIGDLLQRITPRLLSPEQIYQRFKDRLPSLQQFHFLREARIAEVNRIEGNAYDVIAKMGRLGHGDAAKLNSVMHDATVSRIHPDLPFAHDDNKHLQVEDPGALARNKADHAALASRYKSLSPDAKSAYQDAKGLGEKMQAEHSDLMRQSISDSIQNAMVKAADKGDMDRVQTLADQLDKKLKSTSDVQPGPYFPLMRHGDYISVGESKKLASLKAQLKVDPGNAGLHDQIDKLERDAGHYVVQAHESMAARDKAVKQYEARGMVGRTLLKSDHLNSVNRSQIGALQHLFEVNFDKETAAHMTDLLHAHYVNSLSANHALSRQLERRTIAGADTDMRRNLAQMVQKEARYTAGQKFNGQIDMALAKVTDEAKGNDQLTRVAHVLRESSNLDRNPVNSPLENALTGLTHIWEIGVSPARMVSYMAQPHMLSVPILSGDFGLGKSFSTMNKASADALRLFQAAKAPDGAWHGSHGLDLSKGVPGVNARELELLRTMQATSQMERGMHTDLNVATEAHVGRAAHLVETMHRVEAWAMGHIDTATRSATALAAYRLHMAKYGDHKAAMQFAQDHTKYTQFEYGRESAPLAFRSGGGVPMARLFFQFRRYQQGCLNLLYTQGEKAMKGDVGAMKSLAVLMGTHALLAGALGMPLAQTALGVANLFHKDDDPEGDATSQLRRHVYDLFGQGAGQAVMDGITAPLGLNMTRSVGMGEALTDDHLMPPGFSRAYDAKNRDKVPALAMGLLGPSGGFLERLMTSRQYFQQGDYLKATEELIPETLAAVLKAGRIGTQGLTDSKGRVALGPDQFGAGSVAATAMGFHTEKEHLYDEENSTKSEVEQSTRTKRGLLTQRFAEALVHGGDTKGVLADVEDYNTRHVGPGGMGRLTPSELLKAAQQYRRSEAFRGASGVGYDPRRERQTMPLAQVEQ